MHKLNNILLALIISSSLTIAQSESPKYSIRYISKKLNKAWQDKWVKIGTLTATCATFYALSIKLNFFAAAPAIVYVTQALPTNTTTTSIEDQSFSTDNNNTPGLTSKDLKEDKISAQVIDEPQQNDEDQTGDTITNTVEGTPADTLNKKTTHEKIDDALHPLFNKIQNTPKKINALATDLRNTTKEEWQDSFLNSLKKTHEQDAF